MASAWPRNFGGFELKYCHMQMGFPSALAVNSVSAFSLATPTPANAGEGAGDIVACGLCGQIRNTPNRKIASKNVFENGE